MGKYLKSIGKAAKYAGLALGAGALTGVGNVVPGFVIDVLGKAGVPEIVGTIAGGYLTPLLGGVIAVALQQVMSHRDEIYKPVE